MDYLTIASLNKEIIDRTDEMNQLRRECTQLRGEVAENKKRMAEDIQVIAESLFILPFEVVTFRAVYIDSIFIYPQYQQTSSYSHWNLEVQSSCY